MHTNDTGREPTDAELERRFEQWWDAEGSGMAPRDLEEHYSHAERVSRIAWMNGAFIASGARPMPDTPAHSTAPELGEECEHGHLARKCETCELIAAEARVAELEAKLAVIEKWTLAAEDKAPGSAVHAAFDRGYDAARRWVALHFKPTAPGKEPTDA